MVEFGGMEIAFDGKQRYDLDLAYATTIHSSQALSIQALLFQSLLHIHICLVEILFTPQSLEGNNKFVLLEKLQPLKKRLLNIKKILGGQP